MVKEKGENLEIVFVSADKSPAEFQVSQKVQGGGCSCHENMQFLQNAACCKTKLRLLAMVPLIALLAGVNSLFLFIMFLHQMRTPAWRSYKSYQKFSRERSGCQHR